MGAAMLKPVVADLLRRPVAAEERREVRTLVASIVDLSDGIERLAVEQAETRESWRALAAELE